MGIKYYTSRALLLGLLINCCYALPTAPSIKSGNITVTDNGTNINIQQIGDAAIIDWQNFDINVNETVNFQQPSTNAVILNRVIGDKHTDIFGKLNANGNIFLLNERGFIFHEGSSINVGSLIASTFKINDQDFLSGKYEFYDAANYEAMIINNGAINATNAGIIALVAPYVSNNGIIQAKYSTVVLSNGSEQRFALDFFGDNNILFALSKEQSNKIIKHTGEINNVQGHVYLTTGNISKILDEFTEFAAEEIINPAEPTIGSDAEGNVILSNAKIFVDDGVISVYANNNITISQSLFESNAGNIYLGIDFANVKYNRNNKFNIDKINQQILYGNNILGAIDTVLTSNIIMQNNNTIDTSTINPTKNAGVMQILAAQDIVLHGYLSANSKFQKGGFIETSALRAINFKDAKISMSGHTGGGRWLLDPEDVVLTNDNITPIINALTENATVTIETNIYVSGNGDITINLDGSNLHWDSNATLELIALGNININSVINAPQGSLMMSAQQNINVIAGINVYNFQLSDGNWHQSVGESALTILPEFNVSNDFNVSGGQFKRFAAGNGLMPSIFNNNNQPYQINDIYGLQGLATFSMNANYQLVSHLDATTTVNWCNGAGFIPIGSIANKFNGSFDGNGYTVTNLYINRSDMNCVGLFGDVENATFNKVYLHNPRITGNNNVGAIIGRLSNNGSINQCYADGGYVYGGVNVGGIIGDVYTDDNNVSLNNVFSRVSYVSSNNVASGGLAGRLHAEQTGDILLNNILVSSFVNNFTYVGDPLASDAVVGSLNGNINMQNVYFNTEFTNHNNSHPGVVGFSTAELKNSNNLSGFDFDSIWTTQGDTVVAHFQDNILLDQEALATLHGVSYNNIDLNNLSAVNTRIGIFYGNRAINVVNTSINGIFLIKYPMNIFANILEVRQLDIYHGGSTIINSNFTSNSCVISSAQLRLSGTFTHSALSNYLHNFGSPSMDYFINANEIKVTLGKELILSQNSIYDFDQSGVITLDGGGKVLLDGNITVAYNMIGTIKQGVAVVTQFHMNRLNQPLIGRLHLIGHDKDDIFFVPLINNLFVDGGAGNNILYIYDNIINSSVISRHDSIFANNSTLRYHNMSQVQDNLLSVLERTFIINGDLNIHDNDTFGDGVSIISNSNTDYKFTSNMPINIQAGAEDNNITLSSIDNNGNTVTIDVGDGTNIINTNIINNLEILGGSGNDTLNITNTVPVAYDTEQQLIGDSGEISYANIETVSGVFVENTNNPSTDPDSTTDPSTDPDSTTDPSTDPDSTTDPSTDPGTTTDPSTDPDSTTDPSTDPDSTTDPSTDPDSTNDPSTNPDSTTDPSTDPDSTTDPSTDPGTTTDPSTDPDSTTDPSTDPDSTTNDPSTDPDSTTNDPSADPDSTTDQTTDQDGTIDVDSIVVITDPNNDIIEQNLMNQTAAEILDNLSDDDIAGLQGSVLECMDLNADGCAINERKKKLS